MTDNASRREELYRRLERNGNAWERQADILNEMADWYEYAADRVKHSHESTARRLLTNDIKEINLSTDFEKIIISSGRGIKLATREEAIQRLNRLYAEGVRKMHYLKVLRKKAGLDQQYTADENKHIEAFIERSMTNGVQ